MKKILVTGGCGYIGSHTIVELIEKGFEIVSIDNYVNSEPVTWSRIEDITGVKVNNYNTDLCDLGALRRVFDAEGDIFGVIHFAALKAVGESVEQPLRYFDNNVKGMINLLTCADQAGVQRFVFSSSCTVYGDAEKLPVTENTPIKPASSPYGRSKQIAEMMMEDLAPRTKMRMISLRYFNPAGAHSSAKMGESPNQPPQNLIPIITEAAYGLRAELKVFGDDYNTRDGSCIRDYIHVEDLAAAHYQAVELRESAQKEGEVTVFNLGTGQGTSVFEAIQAFERVTGKKVPYSVVERRSGDIPAIYSNSEKAHQILGWKPTRSIEDIMRSAWNWEVERRKGS